MDPKNPPNLLNPEAEVKVLNNTVEGKSKWKQKEKGKQGREIQTKSSKDGHLKTWVLRTIKCPKLGMWGVLNPQIYQQMGQEQAKVLQHHHHHPHEAQQENADKQGS
ncbi:BnaC04g33250D [Brassica napus]|uniref:BnaC04g33250D protein n=1 Tax=Brassica napus TaxID=3708 RepID=A0A078I968_BRANA|nr:BnaC04g33250D [Brassica napus]